MDLACIFWGSRVEQRRQRPPVVAPIQRAAHGVGPAISFVANDNQHNMSYYLVDEIYPRWPIFVKTIRCPTYPKKIYFAQRQEAARKDVERAFGVLQARWAAVKGPTWLWYDDCIADVMYACIIMHNMIVENEDPELTDWANEDAAGLSMARPPPMYEWVYLEGTPKGSKHLPIFNNKKLIFDSNKI